MRGNPASYLAAAPLPGFDPKDTQVGWGVVLPEQPGLNSRELALADDAPEPIRRLAAVRSTTGVPIVLRYRAGDLTWLYRYLPDGVVIPVPTDGNSGRGVMPGALPRYLLLLGPPEFLPWELQIILNNVSFVGRLDLDETGLSNYVEAALSSWATAKTDSTSPLVWTVEHGPTDITRLMREEVGGRVLDRWRSDSQIGYRAVDIRGERATADGLADALAEHRPTVVVTTSHGATDLSSGTQEMRRTLGQLFGADHQLVEPTRLLREWEPDGVVWYALACCSAGGSGLNLFEGMLDSSTPAGSAVAAVAQLGPVSATLPRALLGAPRPARAVIGHIEPTFSWTMRRPDNQASTTEELISALYDKFFQPRPWPVGPAFRSYFDQAASQRATWSFACGRIERDPTALNDALLANLTAVDRQCTVILGDPAVAPADLPDP